MRKVILSVALSLDGFIEGPQGEFDWCPPPADGEMSAFLNRIDTIFMGRKSFESFDAGFFPGKKIVVFSKTLVEPINALLVKGDISTQVQALKEEHGKNIWLYGGASLTTTFINEELIDEMWLGVVPVILGGGKPLFQNIGQRKKFKIEQASNNDQYLSVRLKKII